MDDRTLREVAWNLWLQNATIYLRYALMKGDECARYKTVYKTDNLREWAVKMINECIEQANEKYDDPGPYARGIAEPYIEALSEMSGLVPIVGSWKTEVK